MSTAHLQEDEIPDEDMHPDFENEEPIEESIITQEELTKQHWINHGMDFIADKLSRTPNTKRAKNVILFIGDGMSHATVAAARMAMGNENIKMSFEEFPYTASSMTYCECGKFFLEFPSIIFLF